MSAGELRWCGRARTAAAIWFSETQTQRQRQRKNLRTVLDGSPPYIGRGRPPSKLTTHFRPNPSNFRPYVFPVFYRVFLRPKVRPIPSKLDGRSVQPSVQIRPTSVLCGDKQHPHCLTRQIITIVRLNDPSFHRQMFQLVHVCGLRHWGQELMSLSKAPRSVSEGIF